MEKKIYVRPEAEHIVFYSEEEIATMNVLNGTDVGGEPISGGVGGADKPTDW